MHLHNQLYRTRLQKQVMYWMCHILEYMLWWIEFSRISLRMLYHIYARILLKVVFVNCIALMGILAKKVRYFKYTLISQSYH